MSSAIFVAELRPDARLRRVMAYSYLIALVMGTGMLAGLPVPVWLRALASAGWCLYMAFGYMQNRAGQQRLQRLRVYADGSVQLLDRDGAWLPATVERDSVVLTRLAWLRVQCADGRRHTELLTGNSRASEDWRHLRVIWKYASMRAESPLGSSS